MNELQKLAGKNVSSMTVLQFRQLADKSGYKIVLQKKKLSRTELKKEAARLKKLLKKSGWIKVRNYNR